MINREGQQPEKRATNDAQQQHQQQRQHSIGTQIVWDDRKQRASVEQINNYRPRSGRQQLAATSSNNNGDNDDSNHGSGKRPLIAISRAPQVEQAGHSGSGSVSDHADSDDGHSTTGRPLDDSKIVADVRENFVALIRYNRLQYFYLGVLVYSVINVILILNSITTSIGQQQQSTQVRSQARQKLFKIYTNNDDETGLTMDDAQEEASRAPSPDCGAHAVPTSHTFVDWLLIVFLLPAILLLLLIIALNFFHFQSVDWRSREAARRDVQESTSARLKTLSYSVGVLLAFALLAGPISTLYLSHIDGSSSLVANGTRADCNGTTSSQPAPPQSLRPPICLVVIIVYLLPYLLDEVRWYTRLLCACLILPLILLKPILEFNTPSTLASPSKDTNNDKHQLLVIACCALFALSAGLIKRLRLNRFTKRQVFDGATESIEAKVSLEQQRQQQETLLLSVLPAYVAEQVKRNMVKKMMGGQQQQESESQLLAGGNQMVSSASTLINCNHNAEVPTSSSTSTSTNQATSGGALCGRSYTLPMAQAMQLGAKHSSSEQGTEQQQQQQQQQQPARNSISRGSKLSSSLACEHLTPTRQSQQQLQSSSSNNGQQQTLPQTTNFNINFMPSSGSPAARRGFNELYIRTYNNVSLLYGDIVGFTQLCTQLSSSQLVGVLNDLFSHFDHLAERNKIMRIKILGDCYYGVSGIPEFAVMGAKSRAKSSCDNHAINCVNMGLDMIQYIKCLNIRHSIMAAMEQQQQQQNASSALRLSFINRSAGGGGASEVARCHNLHLNQNNPDQNNQSESSKMPAFELNMRIGVHTGHIHSGVIGLKKWQFDIWSNDVSIAMHCESSGVAGRVQVTEATVQHLHGTFEFEPSPCSGRDQLLADREIKTYLISDRVVPSAGQKMTSALAGASSAATGQQHLMTTNHRMEHGKQADDHAIKTRTQTNKRQRMSEKQDGPSFMNEDKIREATIGTIRETLLAGETANSNPSNAYALALDHNDLDSMGLRFSEATLERSFSKRPISIESRSAELLILFLLLTIAMSCLNLQYSPNTNADSSFRFHLVLLTFATVTSLFLVANLILSLRTELVEHSNDLPKTSPIARASSDNINRWQANSNSDQSYIVRKLSQVSAKFNSRTFLRARKSSFDTIRRCSINKLSLVAILLAYSTVIIEQVYILASRLYCQQGTNSNGFEMRTSGQDLNWIAPGETDSSSGQSAAHLKDLTASTIIEHYHLTVILILFALDLCVSTISYRMKFRFLLAIMMLQLAVLVLNPIEPLTVADRDTASSSEQIQSICRVLTHWTYESPVTSHTHRGSTERTTRTRGDYQYKNQQQQQLIHRSTDALLLVLALWSLAFARQLEYTNRTNFLWRNRLNVDHEELEYISGINKVLLENILPSHVVQHYLAHPTTATATTSATIVASEPATAKSSGSYRLSLTKSSSAELMRLSLNQMRNLHDELYHEQHDSVAVMFASIPHFYEFYDESDISKQGLGCIALLNEIICDFDRLLLKNKFSRIEKIKTIGSTYMAAAGLRPCHLVSSRNSAASQISQQINLTSATTVSPQLSCNTNKLIGTPTSEHHQPSAMLLVSPMDERRFILSQQKLNLICMIQFASSLMSALNGINKQSFQVFKLRVGINTGPVIAGVIGSQRPFYDIWGDCVNIASRMESLGEVGRIQVEEQTAQLLMECLCADTYAIARRGPINVKGKGGMVTYFVDKKQGASQNQPTIGITTPTQHQALG